MQFITFPEIMDIIVMTFAIGYIFSRLVTRKPTGEYDPLEYYKKTSLLEELKYGAMIAAPAVVLHELAHKFAAMSFGATAVLHAPSLWGIPYGMYLLVIFLIHINFPLIFFVGGYVAHTPLPALQSAAVAIAGPLTNLLIWFLCMQAIKNKWVKRKYFNNLSMIAKLNMFFFVFNILPLPGFDGFNFLSALFSFFF